MESPERTSRRYGVSCLICRRRKVRCCGTQPTCQNCLKSGTECSYKSSDAVARKLQVRLEKTEGRIQDLEVGIKKLVLANSQGERANLAAELGVSENDRDDALDERERPQDAESETGASLSQQEELEEPALSVDEHGELQYFGATSRFHIRPDAPPTVSKVNADYHKRWLLSNSRFYASWEKMAHKNLPQYSELDEHAATTLLQIFWTWQAPLHNHIYRPCFYRDLAMDGPYFSPFLLMVIFAHACRHTQVDDARFGRYNKGEYFLAKAKLLLTDEFARPKPRIPTIQGLLVLGGRQCAVGKHSEGWLYTGMAIRMLQDLGLHLNPANSDYLLEGLEPDDLEARKRLYLSAYAWDKSISLSLGRLPTLRYMPYPPHCLFDPAGDDQIWRPHYMPDVEKVYPATASLCSLTFSHFCQLSMLIDETYSTIYGGKLRDVKSEAVVALEKKVRGFYQQLPVALRADNITSMAFCPPPHISCLNMLYHTLLILLYRPFFRHRCYTGLSPPKSEESQDPQHQQHIQHHLSEAVRRARVVCSEEARLVNDLFRAYGRSFRFQKQSYLMSYCVYTAATIELEQLDSGTVHRRCSCPVTTLTAVEKIQEDAEPERHEQKQGETGAAERLETILSMLETEARQTPGIQRSIDIIKTRLFGPAPTSSVAISLPSVQQIGGGRVGDDLFETSTEFAQQQYSQGRGNSNGVLTANDNGLHQSHIEDTAGGLGSMSGESILASGLAPQDVPMGPGWVDYNVGGGFVADQTNWGHFPSAWDNL